jgi:hypothetical protein
MIILGQIPSWLSVTLVRNGPGMFKIGDTEYKHWFDGLAYIQRYYFKNGKVPKNFSKFKKNFNRCSIPPNISDLKRTKEIWRHKELSLVNLALQGIQILVKVFLQGMNFY